MKTFPHLPVLVIDDDQDMLTSLELHLLSIGIDNIILCQDSRKVEDLLKKQAVSIILLDLTMPYITGEELLPIIHENHPHIPVLVITAIDDVNTAVQCMRNGAYDFFNKPIDEGTFYVSIKRAIENTTLKEEINSLKEHMLSNKLTKPEAFSSIISQNSRMEGVFHYMEAVAPSQEPVLITGEAGVGKELISKAIHDLSNQSGDFVTVNVAGLDDHMFTDTLFGHLKGSFTGAVSNRKGLVEKAAGGTLFLDEIGDLSLASQVKLLRLLQEKEYYPLGSDIPKYSNTRILVATNQPLEKMISEDTFRKDLYYRLKVHSIHIPPLRERLDDLPLLVDTFLEQAASSSNRPVFNYPFELIEYLNSYQFPGNIRELRAILFDAAMVSKSAEDLVGAVKNKISILPDFKITHHNSSDQNSEKGNDTNETRVRFYGPLPSLKEVGIILIEEAMDRTGGNQSKAARLIGITHQALNQRLKKKSK